MRAHAIAPQPGGRRQFEHARQPAVIGEQQQAFGVEVEPADADQPRQVLRQRAEDGRPALRVGVRGHQPARLVIEEQPRALAPRQRLAVDRDRVGGRDVERRRGDRRAVDRDAPGRDPGLGLAPRGTGRRAPSPWRCARRDFCVRLLSVHHGGFMPGIDAFIKRR